MESLKMRNNEFIKFKIELEELRTSYKFRTNELQALVCSLNRNIKSKSSLNEIPQRLTTTLQREFQDILIVLKEKADFVQVICKGDIVHKSF